MTSSSNTNGRAYEYIFLMSLAQEISRHRTVEVIENSSYNAALSAWESIEDDFQEVLTISAMAAMETIFEAEPLIIEPTDDVLTLEIQDDGRGEVGDVRDIVVTREDIEWEIGLSLKHNHFAVKHSRLGKGLDFGEKWFNLPCSQLYWDEIKPIFDYLTEEKEAGKRWRELPDKDSDVYIPLLKAFVDEVKRSYELDATMPKKMVEYLLGHYDFYKVISIDRQEITRIQAYNLRGTLNKPSSQSEPTIYIPEATLPTRLVDISIKPGSTNRVEMYLDGGWQFSFRIHNASSKVETSLKFDVEILGMPTSIITINCIWR